jgi:hypothetical protein
MSEEFVRDAMLPGERRCAKPEGCGKPARGNQLYGTDKRAELTYRGFGLTQAAAARRDQRSRLQAIYEICLNL